MSSEEPIFVIKSSPCQQPWRSVCRRGCRPQQAQKKGPSCQQQRDTYGKRQLLFVHFEKWTWTFLHVNSSGRPPFTHIHTLRRGGGPNAPNSTPSPCKTVAWTSQLSSSHVLPIHRRSDSRPTWRPHRQTLRERRSNFWHQYTQGYGVLAQVRGRHFLTIATSPRHVFAHARGSRSDRDPRSRRDLCAQVTPRRRTKEPLS